MLFRPPCSTVVPGVWEISHTGRVRRGGSVLVRRARSSGPGGQPWGGVAVCAGISVLGVGFFLSFGDGRLGQLGLLRLVYKPAYCPSTR